MCVSLELSCAYGVNHVHLFAGVSFCLQISQQHISIMCPSQEHSKRYAIPVSHLISVSKNECPESHVFAFDVFAFHVKCSDAESTHVRPQAMSTSRRQDTFGL